MNEEKRNELLISEKGSTELWTVVKAQNGPDIVSVDFNVQRPERYCKGPDEVTYSVKKKAYSSAEVEGFKKQLSNYYYEVLEMSVETNDDWGVDTIVSQDKYTEDINIGDAIVRNGKLFGLFIDGSKVDSPFHSCHAVSFKNGASVWLQGRSYARDNGFGYVSSIWSDSDEYIITLKLRNNG